MDRDLKSQRQIVRTSSGQILYFFGNGYNTGLWDGWIKVMTPAPSGTSWNFVGELQWYYNTGIGAALDSSNVIHVLTYNWNLQPTYAKFNTIDSPAAHYSWEAPEALERLAAANSPGCGIAIDSNDVPHVVYLLSESYKGNRYLSVHYSNKIGGIWNRQTVIPVTARVSSWSVVEIAIGPDNFPYLLLDGKVLEGNGNNPTAFEQVSLGGTNQSFVIHRNGDVRVGLTLNGNYVNYVHDATQSWQSGWQLFDSGRPDSGILTLANDIPYTIEGLDPSTRQSTQLTISNDD